MVRTVASGICHSDYSVAHGVLRSPFPVVLGHEGAGIVEAVGPGVTHVKPGDKVIASLSPSCGKCGMCRESKEYMCSQMNKLLTDCTQLDGTTRHKTLAGEDVYALCGVGSFGEYMVMPAGSAIKVPDDTPLDVTCLIGCGVTTGTGAALNTAKVQWGESVAVIGCGGVGLSILQGARIAGASPASCSTFRSSSWPSRGRSWLAPWWRKAGRRAAAAGRDRPGDDASLPPGCYNPASRRPPGCNR